MKFFVRTNTVRYLYRPKDDITTKELAHCFLMLLAERDGLVEALIPTMDENVMRHWEAVEK